MSTVPFTLRPKDDGSPERAFSSVAYWMGIVGRTSILFAFLLIVSHSLVFTPGSFVEGAVTSAVLLVVGMLTLNAAAAFRKVASMDEQSPAQLRQAVLSLRNLFRILALVIAVQAVVLLISATVAWWG